jgi:alpha/beta superfamily hydrolase
VGHTGNDLHYRGYDIIELAEGATFEEVTYLLIHGELDDTVPLANVLAWARPQDLPVTVIPGVAHFFHGQLPLLKSLVVRHLRA